MRAHKKAHLTTEGVFLERRRYIGFGRTPVLDDRRNYPDGIRRVSAGDPVQEYQRPDRPRFDL